MKRSFAFTCVTVVAVAAACFVAVGRTFAGTYANIVVQGAEAPGTEFNDWAGIPVLDMDPLDNPGGPVDDPFIDIKDVQIANNGSFLFIRISYHGNSSSGTFVALDTDQNTATGFNIFGLGLVGSEVGYVNDFVFSQTNGIFNTNVSFTGGPLGNGGALIFPFWDQDGTDKEMAIPLDAQVTFPAGPAFPNPSMNILIYSDQGLGDVSTVISYTLASPPGIAGDYNNNGTVDAADYVLWRNGGPLQNETVTIGSTTPEDYDAWRGNFGAHAGGGAGAALAGSVPEPTSIYLLVLAFASMFGVRRFR